MNFFKLAPIALIAVSIAGAAMEELSWTPSDLAQIQIELEAAIKKAQAGTTSVSRQLMLEEKGKNNYVLVVHRNGSGPAEWHDSKTDMYFTLAGEGEVIVGGKMPSDQKEMDGRPGEWRGSKLVGGVPHRMFKGHVINIPPQTPHQVTVADGKTLTFLIVKVIAP